MATAQRIAKAVRRWSEAHHETYATMPEIKHYHFPKELDAVALMAQELAPHLLILQLALVEAIVSSLQILDGQVENLRCKPKPSPEQLEVMTRLSRAIPVFRRKQEILSKPLLMALIDSLSDPFPNYAKIHRRVFHALLKSDLASREQEASL